MFRAMLRDRSFWFTLSVTQIPFQGFTLLFFPPYPWEYPMAGSNLMAYGLLAAAIVGARVFWPKDD